jgi:CheY-like chemotaxis protein
VETPSTARCILIIEDDADVRSAIAEVLTSEGHLVAEAEDGLHGLRTARDQRPDLILLDLMMPIMDGWAFRAAQQADPTLADIPVVVVSAMLQDQVHAIGAVAHLHKPFNLVDLLEVVDRHTAAV